MAHSFVIAATTLFSYTTTVRNLTTQAGRFVARWRSRFCIPSWSWDAAGNKCEPEARRAPGSPEINQSHFASQRFQSLLFSAEVRQTEIGIAALLIFTVQLPHCGRVLWISQRDRDLVVYV